MLRRLRSALATLLIVAGLVTTAIPALAEETPEYASWNLVMDEAALKMEAEALTPTCTDAGYALSIEQRPKEEVRLSLPVECPDIGNLAPGDSGLVGRYRVRYGGAGTVNLTFAWELEGALFTGDHPIAVTIVDDRGNDYSPTTLPSWLEPFVPTTGSKKAPSLSKGDEITFTATYQWPLEAKNEYQAALGHLRMWLVVTPKGGSSGGGGGGGGGGTPPGPKPPTTGGGDQPVPSATGTVVVRVLGDPTGSGDLMPLAGVPVSLGELSGTTDAEGRATFAGLRFGSYTATATAPNPLTGVDPLTGSGATTISPEEPEGQITILLQWAPAPIEEPTPAEEPPPAMTGSLTIRVLDGSIRLGGATRPIPNAVVQVGDRIGRTNLNGEVYLRDLPLEAYEIHAEAVDPDNPVSGERQSASARTTLTPEKRHDVVTLILAWSDASSATVDLTPGSIVGRICAPRDPGARIWATNEAGEVVAIAVAATGRLGQWRDYALDGLTPGKWVLSLQNPGDPSVSQDVVVRPGEAARAFDFTLACTGDGASQLPNMAYFLFGGALLVGGLYLRRLGLPAAPGRL